MDAPATIAQTTRAPGLDTLLRRTLTILVLLAIVGVWTGFTIAFTGGGRLWFQTPDLATHLAVVLACLLSSLVYAGLVKGSLDERLRKSALFALSPFGLYALAILTGRLFFSRPMLASTMVETLFVSALLVVLRRGQAAHRVAIIANEDGRAPFIQGAQLVDDPAMDLRRFDVLLVSSAEMASQQWAGALSRAMLGGAKVRHVGEFFEERRGAVSLAHFDLEDLSTAGIASYRNLKRGLDIGMVLLLAPAALALTALAMMAVALTMGRPVFFLQERIGLAGKPFTMWKLRTMRARPADPVLQATVAKDGRVTRVGAVLRRYRIDELPQLWNVLKGEMSMIGPRPEASPLHQTYLADIPHYAYRYLVRPGITGWAQVRCPPSANADEARTKLTFDLYYVKHVSLLLDFKIMAKTLWTLIEGGGVR